MSIFNKNNKFKITIGLLLIMLVALGAYTVSIYKESENTRIKLAEDKRDIQNELEEIMSDYDQAIEESDIKDQKLLDAKKRIKVLLDSIKGANANIALISKYRVEVSRLKRERKELFRKVDSLQKSNDLLAIEVDSTNQVLNKTIRTVDSVNNENSSLSRTLAKTLEKGSVVRVLDLRGSGVIVKKSGKVIDTKRSSRADKIRVCFTLAPNSIAKKGDRFIYLQVINPENNLLGKKAAIDFPEGTLSYSNSSKVFYEQEELDMCILVDVAENKLIEGLYTVNVFDGSKRVATSTMELK